MNFLHLHNCHFQFCHSFMCIFIIFLDLGWTLTYLQLGSTLRVAEYSVGSGTGT